MSPYVLTALINALLFQTIMGAWALCDYYFYAEPLTFELLIEFVLGACLIFVLHYIIVKARLEHSKYRFTDDHRLVCHSVYAPFPIKIPTHHILKLQPVVVRAFLLPERVMFRLMLGGKYAYLPISLIVYPESEDKFICELKENNPNILVSEEVKNVSFKSA